MYKFDTTTPITAILDIPAGRIQVIAADRADTTVQIRPADTAKARDVKAAAQTTVEYTDGVLQIDGTPAKSRILGNSGSVEVTIQLPAGSHIHANAAAAEFRGVGRLGDLTLDGAYGTHDAVKIDEAADIHLSAHAGNIQIGRLTGPAQITTGKGDIHITEATHGTVVLNTHTGDLTIATTHGTSATLNADTTHGRITNTLKNDGTTDLTIHATTSHGNITAHSL